MSDAPQITVRDLVNAFKREVLQGDLAPQRAAEIELKLSALLGNILEEIRNAEALYADVLLKCMESEGKANRAKVRAQTTPEYLRKQAAKDCHTLAVEMIRSLRGMLRMATEEMRLTR